MRSPLSPIVLFAFNRPDHLRATVEALKQNLLAKDSDLVLYLDGPKSDLLDSKVLKVCEYAHQIDGFKSIQIIERETNLGLANSVINGVSEVVSKYEKVIVLEDDMVTSPYFLSYMNDSLEHFNDDERVISIHGYVYPVKDKLPESFFLRGADCWGWATWKRGWEQFNPDGQYLLQQLAERDLVNAFNFNGSYSFSKMLEEQVKGSNDSWAVRWYASAFLAGKLTLYPGRSLVHNIGNDSSGVHCGEDSSHDVLLAASPIDLNSIEVQPSAIGTAAFDRFFKENNPSFMAKLINRLKKVFA